MKHAINWFAIPATDFKRAVKFYNSIFDFKLSEMKMGTDDIAFFPIEQGGIGGHITVNEKIKPSADGPVLYLNGGEDLQTILDRVEISGGEIVHPKTQVTPEIGYIALFLDSEGNRVALHSPK
ncbi:MAG: VOC family protein [Ignavibacteria bacterium]